MIEARCKHRNVSSIALLALAALLQTGAAFAGLTVMHGYVDYASALVWIQTEREYVRSGTSVTVWRTALQDSFGPR